MLIEGSKCISISLETVYTQPLHQATGVCLKQMSPSPAMASVLMLSQQRKAINRPCDRVLEILRQIRTMTQLTR